MPELRYIVIEIVHSVPVALIVLVVMSLIVSKTSDKLGDILHQVGLCLKIPTSVRGATFDAVSSSFPEFSTAMIAVIFYNKFTDVGLPTIAGSAIFNILLIPMASILFFKGINTNRIVVKRGYLIRDIIFYLLGFGGLFFFTWLGFYNRLSGLVLIAVYGAYVLVLGLDTKKHRQEVETNNNNKEEEEELSAGFSLPKAVFFILIAITIIWISIDFLIQAAVYMADAFGVPAYIISVVILAACTSIPDTILSVKSARRGDADGAVANAIGSNIFDICVCLGVPMLFLSGSFEADFEQNFGILLFVFFSLLLTGSLLLPKKGVGKKGAFIMLGFYAIFIGYVVSKIL